MQEEHRFRISFDSSGSKPVEKRQTSGVVANRDQKHRLMGAKNVYMAKPWRHEIYINGNSFPHPVIKHEIAHVVAGEFGSKIFKVSASGPLGLPLKFNVGMIEGIATALDWPHQKKSLTPHESVKALRQLKKLPPLERLFSTDFFAFSSSRGYTTSGSFLKFLLDTYGKEKLMLAYKNGGNFDAAYSKSLLALKKEWELFIDQVNLADGAAEVVRERFRREGIFQRPCARAIPRTYSDIAVLESKGKRKEAIRLAEKICSQVAGEPRHVLNKGILQQRTKHLDDAYHSFKTIWDKSETVSSSLRVEALLEMVDIDMSKDRKETALSYLSLAKDLPLPDRYARQVDVHLSIIGDDTLAGDFLRKYFYRDEFHIKDDLIEGIYQLQRAQLENPNSGLAKYLLARRLSKTHSPTEITELLVQALDLGLSPLVERETAVILAASAYKSKDKEAFIRAINILGRNDQTTTIKLLGENWLERKAWKDSLSHAP